MTVSVPPERIDAYHFYEDEWSSYGQLRDAFEWDVPARFNVARYVCDRWAAVEPDRPALRVAEASGPARDLGYGTLHERANRLASALAAWGVDRGDRIVVHGRQRPETLVAFVAAWKLGAAVVPVSSLVGPDGLGYRFEDCEPAAVVASADAIGAVRDATARHEPAAVLVVGDAGVDAGGALEEAFEDALDAGSPEFETADTDADETATVIYTSGTTGQPKGVLLPHRVLLGHLPQFVTIVCDMSVREDDLIWTPVEWTWVASVYIRLLPALYYGVPMLAYDRGEFDPAEAFELIDRHGVTIFGTAPTALRMMTDVDPAPYNLERVRVVGGGGESFGEDLRAWARETFGDPAIHEGYGQTEANGLVGECTALAPHRPGRVGLAGVGHDVRIVDPETVEPLPPGEVGEFAVRTEGDPVISAGYLNRPEAMAEKRRNGYHLTGDLGRVDEDGYFAFEGRKDQVIVSAGYRIGPSEIEDQLTAHGAVSAAGVVGVPDETRGEVPKAFVVLADGYEPTDELRAELQAFVRERLAKYEYPRELAFVEELPKTSTGKVARSALREREIG